MDAGRQCANTTVSEESKIEPNYRQYGKEGGGAYPNTYLPTYRAWVNIKTKCYNRNSPQYGFYGARGIGICKEWRYNYRAFWEYVGCRPTPKHSLERIDNNRDYEPGNVRWATAIEQCNNTRRNVQVTINGRTQTLAEWCRELKFNYATALNRRHKGWKDEELFIPPVKPWGRLG